MIVLATNKSIMRSKLLIMLFEFRSHDWFVSHKNDHEIETLKSIIRQFWPHENCRDQEIESIIRNFDLMIDNLISWKGWILISWNLTSWPWVIDRTQNTKTRRQTDKKKKDKKTIYNLDQGFSTFWYSRTPNSKMNSFRVPPKQHLIPLMYLLWAYFAMISISTYPLQTPCVPLGVRIPQVENRWPR